jgi:hypothetical protein
MPIAIRAALTRLPTTPASFICTDTVGYWASLQHPVPSVREPESDTEPVPGLTSHPESPRSVTRAADVSVRIEVTLSCVGELLMGGSQSSSRGAFRIVADEPDDVHPVAVKTTLQIVTKFVDTASRVRVSGTTKPRQ